MAGSPGKGHPNLGAIAGLLFGFFVSVTLTVYANVPLDSVLHYVLTIAGMVTGLVLGFAGRFHGPRALQMTRTHSQL
ncbi:MAG: hypothetical protein ACRDVP_06195 [Acidimicrobiales bacterium]